MFSSRNIHFGILGIILGAMGGYIFAFYQATAAAPPPFDPTPTSSASASASGMPANHPQVNEEEMMALLKKAAESSPDQPEVLSRYANQLFQADKLEESAEWYAKVVALEPKNTDVRSLYGAVLFRIGKKTEAKSQLEEALKQDPKHVPSMHGLFIIAIDNHDVAAAKDLLARIEKAEPEYPGMKDLKARLAKETSKKS